MSKGWYPRRRGVLEHLERGIVSLLHSAVHDFLCLIADHRTGVAWASAEKIRALCPSDIGLKSIQRSLAKLERLQWIRRFRTHGKKGNYPIVIGKYFVRDRSLTWWSVNLEKTSDFRNVRVDRVTDPSFVTERAVTCSVTEPGTDAESHASPSQEVRIETNKKDGKARREFGGVKRHASNKDAGAIVSPPHDLLPEDLWRDFRESCEVQNRTLTKARSAFLIGKLKRFKASGLDVTAIVENAIAAAHLDFYEPKGREV